MLKILVFEDKDLFARMNYMDHISQFPIKFQQNCDTAGFLVWTTFWIFDQMIDCDDSTMTRLMAR